MCANTHTKVWRKEHTFGSELQSSVAGSIPCRSSISAHSYSQSVTLQLDSNSDISCASRTWTNTDYTYISLSQSIHMVKKNTKILHGIDLYVMIPPETKPCSPYYIEMGIIGTSLSNQMESRKKKTKTAWLQQQLDLTSLTVTSWFQIHFWCNHSCISAFLTHFLTLHLFAFLQHIVFSNYLTFSPTLRSTFYSNYFTTCLSLLTFPPLTQTKFCWTICITLPTFHI